MFLASVSSFYHLRSVFLDRVIHFGETLEDQIKVRSPKKLKSLIEVPNVVHVKVHVWSFNMILMSFRSMFLDRVMHFGKISGDEVKGRSPKMLKSLIWVPYVAHLKVQVLSFNMIFISSPWHVHRPSYPFRWKFGISGKGSFTEKVKIVNWGSQCSPRESASSNLQYDSYLISVACSYTELSISEEIWEIR